MKFQLSSIVLITMAVFSGASCSSSGSNGPAAASSKVGGALAGPEDTHCDNEPAGVSDPAVCLNSDLGNLQGSAGGAGGTAGDSAPADSGGAAGASDCALTHDAQYGETLYNAAGHDDDCKYRVSWVSTPIRKGENVTFTVTAMSNAGEPLERIAAQKAGELALSRVEPYVPCDVSHAPPSADFRPSIVEISPGVFTVGPIVFDESGRWTLRFHFYESCFDSETSPHGHIAFFVDVP
jgi:hypothetical protein